MTPLRGPCDLSRMRTRWTVR